VPEDVAVTEEWMVPAMVLVVYQHRRRISQLLNRLDVPLRGAVEAAVSALAEGRVDAATVLAELSEGVCEGEGRVHHLIELLEMEPFGEAVRLDPSRPVRTRMRRTEDG
jgi:hypothetical protein